MEIPDILPCDHFFPKFYCALNNSPSDEILPTERLILRSFEHVSHLKSYKCAATETRSSFWCNCCYNVEFFFVLSFHTADSSPLPPCHVMSHLTMLLHRWLILQERRWHVAVLLCPSHSSTAPREAVGYFSAFNTIWPRLLKMENTCLNVEAATAAAPKPALSWDTCTSSQITWPHMGVWRTVRRMNTDS